MEHYIINMPSSAGEAYTVLALTRYLPEMQDVLLFDVYREGALLGTIYPTISESGEFMWVSDDMDDRGVVELVGEKIERQDW